MILKWALAANAANGQHQRSPSAQAWSQTYTVPSIADEDRIIELANDGMGQMEIREINKDQEILLSRKNVRTILDNHGLSGTKPKSTTTTTATEEKSDEIQAKGEQHARREAGFWTGPKPPNLKPHRNFLLERTG